MGISVVLFILFSMFTVCSTALLDTVRLIDHCPQGETAWNLRAQEYGCPTDFQYHCAYNTSGSLYEFCAKRYTMNSRRDGCPLFHITSTSVDLAYPYPPYSDCPQTVTGCPEENHPSYTTDQLYKYPKCTVQPMERTNEITTMSTTPETTTKQKNDGITNTYSSTTEGNPRGFTNTDGSSTEGNPRGFTNTDGSSTEGNPRGFTNTDGSSTEGNPRGFTNTDGSSTEGNPRGFTNTDGSSTEGNPRGTVIPPSISRQLAKLRAKFQTYLYVDIGVLVLFIIYMVYRVIRFVGNNFIQYRRRRQNHARQEEAYLLEARKESKTSTENRRRKDLDCKMKWKLIRKIKGKNGDGKLLKQITEHCAKVLKRQPEDAIHVPLHKLFQLLEERSVIKIGQYNALKKIVQDDELIQIIDNYLQLIKVNNNQGDGESNCLIVRIDNRELHEELQEFKDTINDKISKMRNDVWKYALNFSPDNISLEEYNERVTHIYDMVTESFELFCILLSKSGCRDTERKEHILDFMTKSKGLMPQNDEVFYGFLERWDGMNESMKRESIENLNGCLGRRDWTIVNIETGCIYLFIECKIITSLDSLWKEYISGGLLQEIQQQKADVPMNITIWEKNYKSYRNYLREKNKCDGSSVVKEHCEDEATLQYMIDIDSDHHSKHKFADMRNRYLSEKYELDIDSDHPSKHKFADMRNRYLSEKYELDIDSDHPPKSKFVDILNIYPSTKHADHLRENMEDLERENTTLKQMTADSDTEVLKALQCKICLTETVAFVYLPCGHLTACVSCEDRLRIEGYMRCPICNQHVEERIRFYMP